MTNALGGCRSCPACKTEYDVNDAIVLRAPTFKLQKAVTLFQTAACTGIAIGAVFSAPPIYYMLFSIGILITTALGAAKSDYYKKHFDNAVARLTGNERKL